MHVCMSRAYTPAVSEHACKNPLKGTVHNEHRTATHAPKAPRGVRARPPAHGRVIKKHCITLRRAPRPRAPHGLARTRATQQRAAHVGRQQRHLTRQLRLRTHAMQEGMARATHTHKASGAQVKSARCL